MNKKWLLASSLIILIIAGLLFYVHLLDLKRNNKDFDATKTVCKYKPNKQLIYRLVCYNNQFITINSKGTITTSKDGLNWLSRKIGIEAYCMDIAYNGKTYVIVGGCGEANVSNDLTNWHRVDSFNNITNPNIIWDNKQFIIYGTDLDMHKYEAYVSNDGLNWIKKDDVFIPKNLLKKDNNFYSTNGPNFFTSQDAVTWSKVNINLKNYDDNHYFHNLIWNGKYFITTFGKEDMHEIFKSSNGVEWNLVTQPYLYSINVIWFKDKCISLCMDNKLFTSDNCYYWVETATDLKKQIKITSETLSHIACNKDKIIVIGDQGTIIESTDGENWRVVIKSNGNN